MSGTDAPAKGKSLKELDRAVIRFAGDSGDGMQLTGEQFTTESAWAGNDIATLPNFPEEGAGRGADLSGEVRQGRDVVAGPRRLGRELLARELHPVAGVPGEPDHGPIQLLQRLALGGGVGSTHRRASPRSVSRTRPDQRRLGFGNRC